MRLKKIYQIFKKKEFLILFTVVILGSVLRLQGVFTNSFAFTYDVGRDLLEVRDIVNFVDFPFIGPTTGLPGVFYGPWWYYFLSPIFVITQGSPQGIAFFMSIIGILTIILAYYLGEKIDGKFLGLSFAALTGVSGALIALSSQIWSPNIAPFFVVLVFLILIKIFSEKKVPLRYYFSLGILLAFIADLEIVFGVLLTGGVALSLIVKKKLKINIYELMFFALGGILILLPRILFELKNNFLMTKAFFFYFSQGAEKKIPIGEAVTDRLNAYLIHFSDTIALGNIILGYVIILITAISLILFFKKAKPIERDFIKTLILILIIFFFGTLFFNHDIWPHYLVGLPVIYILLFAISVNLLKKNSGKFLPVLIIIFLFIFNFNPQSFYEGLRKPFWEGDAALFRNQLAVIDYVYKQSGDDNFKYVVYTPPLHDYTYKYLFDWYGPSKYGYAPVEKSDLAFFILEPDHENPQRLSDWLKLREQDGRVIAEKEIKGGIIVQTRVR